MQVAGERICFGITGVDRGAWFQQRVFLSYLKGD